jgi:hypothetical protein
MYSIHIIWLAWFVDLAGPVCIALPGRYLTN